MVSIVISKEDVVEAFVRSAGPGGQNVNKVATCVQLLHKPTGIVIKCRKYRQQHLNRQEAWELLRQAVEQRYQKEFLKIRQAAAKKRRQNRKRSLSAKERILATKKIQSLKKQNRKGIKLDD